MIEIGGYLYVGLSNLPAGSDGGCVARIAPSGVVTVEYPLPEQGCHGMHLYNGELFVPGTDPVEAWAFGNIHVRDTNGTWAKRRTLPNVIHCWGLCHDGSGHLWAAVGAHAGDNVTWEGRVTRSSDDGLTWDASIQLNDYRMMDITWFADCLWANGYHWTGEYYQNQLWRSTDEGTTWQQIAGIAPSPYQRFVEHGERLYCLKSDGTAVLEILPSAIISMLTLPERCISIPLNTLASDGTNLYYLDRNGVIWNALSNVQISSIPGAISLGCWPSQNCLVASTSGAQAALYKINLN